MAWRRGEGAAAGRRVVGFDERLSDCRVRRRVVGVRPAISRRGHGPIDRRSSGPPGSEKLRQLHPPGFGTKLRARVSDGFAELLGNSRRLYDNFMRIAVERLVR
jgi:hypothetical protein